MTAISAWRAAAFTCLLFALLASAYATASPDGWPLLRDQLSWSPSHLGQTPLLQPHEVHEQQQRRPDDVQTDSSGKLSEHGSTLHPKHVLRELRDALDVMQTTYFELWVGAWPTSIDWTGAVINTHLVSSLSSLTRALDLPSDDAGDKAEDVENELNLYFAQSIAYYFGENTFAIRNEAYDDMLWVVLGWLEAIKFIDSHSQVHYRGKGSTSKPWHGSQFVYAFAHRARVFYDLAKKGWDTKLCGGGMVWNPSLGPYKNAITNELFISAAVSMYLHFPGDCNDSPFSMSNDQCRESKSAKVHDFDYLRAAIRGYDWLKDSNMLNYRGLYTDGFHIKDWGKNGTIGTGKCDVRNEAVYTYNQGVLLTGLRGLWESTGDTTYLKDGHELIRNVIRATGWDLEINAPSKNHRWSGLGRAGIIEDFCDSSGRCNQDGQSFKGIYFHHFTTFCAPLPSEALVPGTTFIASKELGKLHFNSCKGYTEWVAHNADGALRNRNEEGRFNGWWGAHLFPVEEVSLPEGAIDYRNNVSELETSLWLITEDEERPNHQREIREIDINTVGPTIETHSGGIAVLRALWELRNMMP